MKLDITRLSAEYAASGYRLLLFPPGDVEHAVVASRSINRLLMENDVQLAMDDEPFHSKNPVDVPQIHSYISEKRLFDGPAIGMFGDLLNDMLESSGESVPTLPVRRISYFDTLGTNGRAYALGEEPESMIRRGDMPGFDERGVLLPMSSNGLPDMIGASIVTITSDGYAVINRQGRLSATNKGRLAPTGSGSVEPADFADVSPDGTAAQLRDVVCHAALREMEEESGIPSDAIRNTKLVGFMRLLARGGQPDFLALSYLDADRSEVLDMFARRHGGAEDGLSEKPFLVFAGTDTKGLAAALAEYDARTVSVQLQATAAFAKTTVL